MDIQDHTTHTTHSGHDSHHGVHICHRCGWPFPNQHPSAKHRRAHKKICGTIDGYTVLIGSQVVSDDDHHSDDDDKEKSPSPKVEIKGGVSRSEEEFTDAVTEFVDTGSAKKALDKDIFFSFKDAENEGTNEVLNAAPVDISKVDTSIKVPEKTDSHVEKTEETEIKTVFDLSESNIEVTKTDELVKDGVVESTPEPVHVSQSQEAKSVDVMAAGEETGQESQTSETITEEAKDSEVTESTPEVPANVGGYHDNVKEENNEKLESVTRDGVSEEIKHEIKPDCEPVSEVVKEAETVEEIKIEKVELDDSVCVGEEIKDEKLESDHKHVPEIAKEAEVDQTVTVINEKMDLDAPNEQIQEVVKEPVVVLTEKKDLEAPELEKSSSEQIQEAAKEPVTVLIERNHEFVEKSDSVLTEKDICTPELEGSSKEQIQEAVKKPDTVLTQKEDLDVPHLEKQSNEHTHEVVEKLDSVSMEKEDLGAPELKTCAQENVVEEPDSVLTEKEDHGAHKSETCSNGAVMEQKVINDRNLVADVCTETVTLKDSSDASVADNKDASGVVPELIVEKGNDTLMNNQDSGADLTVDSVLSTTSTDAETLQSTEKSEVNSGKSTAATSDVYEPPSFMTLVEPEKDNKSASSEVQDSQQKPNSDASQAGWFPTLTDVNKESEGRKKNDEEMAKVTNLSDGKQSTPLKNLLGEARSPSGKQPEPVVQKDEAAVNSSVNDDVLSPPKLIDEGKKGRKKVKGISSWVPFACCSSVNAVK
ncbi:hypothetical protein M8C21_008265 [Ambrosia artemisiifolia]|uniref:C2H2-type domain-containing protein n=1 Tax=Ambrosia artemisiifolia TaxID=4212 RepID=A0AAD5D0X5_AMBAR|nr:hypothetical protein M8C21_008265 [Ambrosia artemisiifolia]